MPRRYVDDEVCPLGTWIFTQRRVYNGDKNGNLTPEKIEKLNAIGMRWESMNDMKWNRFYEEAKAYFNKNGNLNTSINTVTDSGYPLGKRICQMRSYRKSSIKTSYLTPERIACLDALGMI